MSGTVQVTAVAHNQRITRNESEHWKDVPVLHQREYVNESWGQWVALCVIMSSFAILINNTGSLMSAHHTNGKNRSDDVVGEPKVASYMIVLAILILCLTTPPYVIQRWKTRSRYMMAVTVFIAAALIVAFVWLLLRIWVNF